MEGNDGREHVTFNHINGCQFHKLSLLQEFTSLTKCCVNSCQILKVPERDDTRVRACNQSENAGSDQCERVLLKTCCRNSYCEGLYHFLCQMGCDLTKDAAGSVPCELQRQLMFQKHPNLLAEIPCNQTLCDAKPYSLV